MKTLLLLFTLMTLNAGAQTKPSILEFGFYLNHQIVSSRFVKCSIVVDKDTIDCPIQSDKISLPRLASKGTFLFKFKKKIYKIEEIDFSKIDENMAMLFGLEKDMENFKLLSPKLPDFYRIDGTLMGITIAHLELAEVVSFVCFNTVDNSEEKKLTVRNYNKSAIVKWKDVVHP